MSMGQSPIRVWDNPIHVATDTCDTQNLNKYFYRVVSASDLARSIAI